MSLVIRTTGFEDYLDRSGGAYIKALMLGLPDAGKTRSASFWPRPIFADCEKGRMSIADRGVAYGEVRSSAHMDALLDQLHREATKQGRRWDTFVVDTLDSYQRILIQERLTSQRKEALSGWQDWGYLDGKMMAFVERLLNLPMNIVVNLHVKTASEEDASIYVPKLKGDIRDSILQEFDLVGFMEQSYEAIEGERHRIRQVRWHASPKYPFLKDRSGRLPEFTDVDFTEEDFSRIFDAVVGLDQGTFPESQQMDVLTTVEPEAPAPPDVEGGPMPTEAPAVKRGTKKAAAGPAAKKAAAKPVAKKATPASEPETPVVSPGVVDVEDVPAPAPTAEATPEATAPTEEKPATDVLTEAEQLLESALDATPVSEPEPEPTAPAAGPDAAAESVKVCGDQPDTMAGKFPPVKGCGRSLAEENRDRVNVALLRTKTLLCSGCFQEWKAAS